jgi:hypothetical protein
MLCPFLDAKERRGARLKIVNKDGTRLEGELIAVKPDSLVLLSLDGRDVSADIAAIDSVQLKTKSKVGWGLLIGGAAGVATGLIAGLAVKERGNFLDDVYIYFSTPFCGLVGLAAGGLTGLLLSQPETIKIGGAGETEIAAAKEKLRKQARIPDFR